MIAEPAENSPGGCEDFRPRFFFMFRYVAHNPPDDFAQLKSAHFEARESRRQHYITIVISVKLRPEVLD
jgi:hypothetical protein